jgi:hypothetical protein
MPEDFEEVSDRIGDHTTIPVSPVVLEVPERRRYVPPTSEEGRLIIGQLLETQKAMQEEARATTVVLQQIALKMEEIKVRVEPIQSMQATNQAFSDRLLKAEMRIDTQKVEFDRQLREQEHEANKRQRFVLSIIGGLFTFGGLILTYVLSHLKWQ